LQSSNIVSFLHPFTFKLLAILKKPSQQKKHSVAGGAKRCVAMENLQRGEISPGCLSSGSVIVYVWRQRDAEALAEHIIAAGVEGGVVFYHGGLEHGQREKAQGQVNSFRYIFCFSF
jgi:superfamily II helicase